MTGGIWIVFRRPLRGCCVSVWLSSCVKIFPETASTGIVGQD